MNLLAKADSPSEVAASRASWYQLAIFESDFSKSKFKMLVGLCPIPYRSASCRCRLRVCSKHSYNKKDSLGLSHNGRILGCHRISGMCFWNVLLFFGKEQFYISLCTEKLLHLFFRFAVVRIGCFLFRQQLGIFRIQFFHLVELFQVGFIESCFCRLV